VAGIGHVEIADHVKDFFDAAAEPDLVFVAGLGVRAKPLGQGGLGRLGMTGMLYILPVRTLPVAFSRQVSGQAR
jgi:hypothetical protein